MEEFFSRGKRMGKGGRGEGDQPLRTGATEEKREAGGEGWSETERQAEKQRERK